MSPTDPFELRIESVKIAMLAAASQKEILGVRVRHKVNERGELVIALIIPPSRPGEWTGG